MTSVLVELGDGEGNGEGDGDGVALGDGYANGVAVGNGVGDGDGPGVGLLFLFCGSLGVIRMKSAKLSDESCVLPNAPPGFRS